MEKVVEASDFEAVRELAVESRKHGLTLTDLASLSRLQNFIQKLGADEVQIELFITDCTNSAGLSPEKIVQLTIQLFNISKAESIPPEQVPSYLKQKFEKKQKLDGQINKADALLQSKNGTVVAINEHVHLSEELSKHGLSIEDPTKLLNLLTNINQYGYDAKRVVAKLSSIRPLEKREKELKNNCRALEKHAAKYKRIFPLTEQILAMGVRSQS